VPDVAGPATAPRSRRAGQTVRDMTLSLTVIVVIVGIVVAFQERGGQRVRVIDPAPTYAGARNAAAYPVRVPRPPSGWRPTSARNDLSEGGRLTLRVGFLTPTGQYAGLVESDVARDALLGRELSPGVRPTGSLTVSGVPWQWLPARKRGDRAIARTAAGVTYLVFGSAGPEELRVLAASLRPAG
jgi:hypothetical protein